MQLHGLRTKDSSAVPNGRYVLWTKTDADFHESHASSTEVALADQVRAVLHGCLLHLHRMPTLKKVLWRQLNLSAPPFCAAHDSMSPIVIF